MTLTFPLRKKQELVKMLNQFMGSQIDVTIEDINKPTKARWKQLFGVILAELCNTSFEYLSANLLPVDELDNLSHEKCEESVQLINLCNCLCCILNMAHIGDCNIRDMVEDSGRLVRILSGIVNILQFKDEGLAHYEAVWKEFSFKEQKHCECSKLRDEQNHRIELLKMKQAEKNNEITKEKMEIVGYVKRLESVNVASDTLQREINSVQLENEEKKAAVLKLRERLAEITDHIQVADADIFHSPERFHVEMKQMENKEQELAAVLNVKNNKLTELKSVVALSSKLCEHYQVVSDCIAMEIKLEEKISQQTAEIQSKKVDIQTLMGRGESKNKDLQDNKYTVNAKIEKQDKFFVQLSMKETYTRNELQELSNGMEQIDKVRSRMTQILAEIENVKENYNDIARKLELNLKNYDECMESLTAEGQVHSDEMKQIISFLEVTEQELSDMITPN